MCSSASIVRDFRDHGGVVLPVDVNHSQWDHTLEPIERPGATTGSGGNAFAIRLGLRQVDGLREETGRRIASARGNRYADIGELYERVRLDRGTLQRLANADAFRSIDLDRRAALWEVKGLGGYLGKGAVETELPLFAQSPSGIGALLQENEEIELPALLPGEQVFEDYETLRLSLKAHPASFLRENLAARRIVQNRDLADVSNGRAVRAAGLVLVRQRPGTASGVIFMTLEDETGIANVIVWPKVFEQYRRIVMGARMVAVEGTLQKEREVIHIIARRLVNLTPQLLDALSSAPGSEDRIPATTLWRHPRATRVLPKGRNFH